MRDMLKYAMLKQTARVHTLVLTRPELIIDKNVFGHCLPAGAAAWQQGLLNALQLTGQHIMHPTLVQIHSMAMAGAVLHGPSWVSCFSPHVCRKGLQEETGVVQLEVVVCLRKVAVLEVGDVGKGETLHLARQGALHAQQLSCFHSKRKVIKYKHQQNKNAVQSAEIL